MKLAFLMEEKDGHYINDYGIIASSFEEKNFIECPIQRDTRSPDKGRRRVNGLVNYKVMLPGEV